MTLNQFYTNVQQQILNPAIAVLFVAAFFLFIWGVIKMIRGADNAEEREKGKQHLIWGIAGMAIMLSAYAIVQIIQATVTNL